MCSCDSREACFHPEEQRDPKECKPEQIRECQGDVTDRCCEGRAAEKK